MPPDKKTIRLYQGFAIFHESFFPVVNYRQLAIIAFRLYWRRSVHNMFYQKFPSELLKCFYSTFFFIP